MFKRIHKDHPVFWIKGDYKRYCITKVFLEYFATAQEAIIEKLFEIGSFNCNRVFYCDAKEGITGDTGTSVVVALKAEMKNGIIKGSFHAVLMYKDDEPIDFLPANIRMEQDKNGLIDTRVRCHPIVSKILGEDVHPILSELLICYVGISFFMDVAEITEEVVDHRQRKKIHGNKYLNKSGRKVCFLTASYLKTVIREEGFKVRGHWRWQPFGKDRKDRKLIFINTFEKKGYIRRADRIIEEKS